jgi:phosphoadenosine phosphosulfate reductase
MTSVLAPSLDAETLRQIADDGDRLLQGASAHEIISWAADAFGENLVATASMGDGVIAHLAASVVPGIEVIFLDTGYHFPETLGTRDAVAQTYDVRVRTVLPLLTVGQQDAQYGPRLHDRDPDACCRMRKVEPLDRALAPYDAWMSGLRRDESAARADARLVAFHEKRQKVVVHPIAAWTEADLQTYITANDVLVNPLQSEGYLSIGCGPCTRAVRPGEDPRAGRWAGRDKTECGIHV